MTKKSIISGYFLDLDVLPNIYESLERVDGGLSPHQQLHQMLLKRLHGNSVTFTPVYIHGYGVLELPTIPYFDLYELTGANCVEEYEKDIALYGESDAIPDHLYCTVFELDDGVVTIDWYHMTFMFTFNQGVIDVEKSEDIIDVDEGVYLTSIDLFKPLHVRVEDDSLNILLSVYTDNKKRREEKQTVENKGTYVHYNRIENGAVVFDDTFDILPEFPVKLKDVSRITGVSASTLSELRHGKKQIDNLSVGTATVLTRYGDIRFLDRFLLDGRMRLRGEVPTFMLQQNDGSPHVIRKENEPSNDVDYVLCMDMENGDVYVTVFDTREEMMDIIDMIYHKNDKPYVMLKSGYKYYESLQSQFDTIVVKKDDVTRIQTKTVPKGSGLNDVFYVIVTMKNGTVYRVRTTSHEEMNTYYDRFVNYMNEEYMNNDKALTGGLDSMNSVDGTFLYSLRGSDISSVHVKQSVV